MDADAGGMGGVMPTEKERFLAVATPEEWRKWIAEGGIDKVSCLFCKAYAGDCDQCRPNDFNNPCSCRDKGHFSLSNKEMKAAAIARLERAGIWEM